MTREGWICGRCKASVSPDERTCPACSLATQPVRVPTCWSAPEKDSTTIFTWEPTAYIQVPTYTTDGAH